MAEKIEGRYEQGIRTLQSMLAVMPGQSLMRLMIAVCLKLGYRYL